MAVLAGVMAFSSDAMAQTASPQTAPEPAENAAPTADDAVMLTAFLKHDQSRPPFPPDGVDVVSWYVMMGAGQVVTLRLPAARSQPHPREPAGGSYRTWFQPTYNYEAIGIAAHDKVQAQQGSAEQFRRE